MTLHDRWYEVVFLSDGEADEWLDRLENRDGDSVVYHGTTEESIARVVMDLAADYDGQPEEERGPDAHYDDLYCGSILGSDKTVEHRGYVLTWNLNLRYLVLRRKHRHTHYNVRYYTGANGHGWTESTCWCGHVSKEDNGW